MAHAGSLAVVGGESLDLKADRLHVDVQKGTALLEGNVAVQMGELAVSCPKVDIRYDEAPQVRWARGSGGVTAQIKGITATANVMALDVAERTVQLSGNVRLSRGRGWVEADRATIDINTRKVNLHDVKGSIPVQPPAR
jgi:lipopolysaccharide transport protein LptA